MGDVLKKMIDQMPNRFLRLKVFLATHMAVPAIKCRIAVKTNFFCSFFQVRHSRNFN